MLPVLFLGLLAAAQGGRAGVEAPTGLVTARAAAPVDLTPVVAAPVYQPDGGMSVETISIPASAPSLVYVYSRRSLCDPAATSASEPTDAAFGWRVAARTVSVSPTQVVVSVDWRRLWDAGRKVANGPAGTVQLTLHAGGRIPLDLIANAAPTDACHAVGMGLEVRAARAATPASARPSNVVLPLGAAEGGARAFDADLWLVHTPPSGAPQVLHQTVSLPTGGGAFTFAPVKFTTSRGEIAVELAGVFRRYRAATGGELLEVAMTRLITGGPLPAGLPGGASTLIALPGPGDVLSFELPSGAPRGGGGGRGGTISGIASTAERGVGGSGGSGFANPGAPGGGASQAPPPPSSPSVLRTQNPTGTVVAGGGGGARGSAPPTARLAQFSSLLEGHDFSLRLKLTPKQ